MVHIDYIDYVEYKINCLTEELNNLKNVKNEVDKKMDEFNVIIHEINIEAESLRSKINRAKKMAQEITDVDDYERVVYEDDKIRINKVLNNNLIFKGFI